MHVLAHRDRTADVGVGAALQPVVQVAAALTQALLHVGARGRGSGRGRGRSRVVSGGGVPREGEVEPMQLAGLQRPLPFELVQELAAEIPVAEEQPVAPTGTDGSALLHEAAERRHRPEKPTSELQYLMRTPYA